MRVLTLGAIVVLSNIGLSYGLALAVVYLLIEYLLKNKDREVVEYYWEKVQEERAEVERRIEVLENFEARDKRIGDPWGK